jgi:hypothetical protein
LLSWAFFIVLILRHVLVYIAPEPALAGLGGGDDGVFGRHVMPSGVLVFRIVAAADVPAFLAHPQVHPIVAEGHAFRADVFGSRCELVEGGEVLARVGHGKNGAGMVA